MQSGTAVSNLFVDDESDFINALEGHLARRGLSETSRITTKPEEGFALVKNGGIATVVAHLNMKGGGGGLAVLERVRKSADAGVECIAITAYEPTDAQREHANMLGVRTMNKHSLPDLLDHLSSPPEMRLVQQRLKMLESMHQEWIGDLVTTLKEIPDFEKAMITGHKEPFTVAQLVKDIQDLRPRGIEYIRLWRRTLGTLSQIRKSQKDRTA